MAFTNYLEDDWNDGTLSGRTNAAKDVFYQYGTGGTGDLLKGVYRPHWIGEDTGDLTVTNGELECALQATHGTGAQAVKIYTTSNQTVGSWQWDIKHGDTTGSTTAGNTMTYFFICDHTGDRYTGNSLLIVFHDRTDTNNTMLQKCVNGTNTALIAVQETLWTTYKPQRATRDSYGNFEMFFDGVSKGTATDSYLPDAKYAKITAYDNDFSTTRKYADNLISY